MRILQISSAKSYHKSGKPFVELCRGLNERGHEVFVALGKESDFGEKFDFLPASNLSKVSLRNSLDVLSARKIAGFLRENKIDLVHAHLARDYPPVSLAVRLYPKSKLIITRHILPPLKMLHKIVLKNVSKVIAVSSAVEANLKKTFPPEKIGCIPYGIELKKME